MFMRFQRGPARVARDAYGREWCVEEVLTSPTAGGTVTRSLIAWDLETIRRTYDYPEGWQQLSDEDLLETIDAGARPRRLKAE